MDYDNIKAEALAAGFDEVQADAIIATLKARERSGKVSDYLLDYPLWKTGKYSAAQGGEFNVESPHIPQVSRAINMLHATGKPVQLLDGHNSKLHLGAIPASRVGMDGKIRSALVGDPNSIAGIRERALGLSIEADQFYSSEEYTNGEEFRFWPTAWAVLPVGKQQAVTPGEPLAAEENDKKPVRLYAHETAPEGGGSSKERGQDTMTIEELTREVAELKAAQGVSDGKISALEAKKGELETKVEDLTSKLSAAEEKRDQLQTEKDAAELKAAEAETKSRADVIIAAEPRPGIREKMTEKLAAAETNDAKKVLLDAWEPLLDKTELEGARLRASENKPGKSEGKSEADSLMDEAEKIQAAEKCTFNVALKAAEKKMKEGE